MNATSRNMFKGEEFLNLDTVNCADVFNLP